MFTNFKNNILVIVLLSLILVVCASFWIAYNTSVKNAQLEQKIESSEKKIQNVVSQLDESHKKEIAILTKEFQKQITIALKKYDEEQKMKAFKSMIASQRSYRFKEYKSEQIDKIRIWSWNGGKTIPIERIEPTVRNVLSRIKYLPNDEGFIRLLLETAATESDFGKFVKQKNNGPAMSIFQIEETTWKDAVWFVNLKCPKFLEEVNLFYEKKKSEEWNRAHNIPWNIARCAMIYYHKLGDQLPKYYGEKEHRAMIYKIYYNSSKGAGSIERFYAKAEEYLES